MKPTAFVGHFDCARHDTGWGHPDHQGRLPALTRAVHADMLTLFDSLLDLEGRHASEEELLLWHDESYLVRARAWVAKADVHGRPLDVRPGLVVSGATWAASTAAVGCVLAAIDSVVRGESRNAFCAVRPPARDARPGEPGRLGLLNPVAIGARYLRDRQIAGRVLLVEWGETRTPEEFFAPEPLRVARIEGVTPDADDARFLAAFESSLDAVLDGGFEPEFILLSSGFDWVAGDPEGGRALSPRAFHAATARVAAVADDRCEGRLVSVLEGGYDGVGLGRCSVQHLRGLAGLPHA